MKAKKQFTKVLNPNNPNGPMVKAVLLKKETSILDEEFQEFFNLISSGFSDWSQNEIMDGGAYRLITYVGKCVEVIEGAIIKFFDKRYGNITIVNRGDGVFYLYRLEIYNKGKGMGSKILKALNYFCAEFDFILELETGKPGLSNGTTTTQDEDAMRIRFYERNNFKITGHKTTVSTLMSNKAYVDAFYENVA